VLGNVSIADCPKLDMICIPGGAGTHDVMEDKYILDWLKAIAPEVSYITSVCTGSLVLAAAGLLVGYKATCHWAYRDTLSLFGAIPTNERVVIDRNRITGGGVTAGIDFALTIIRQLRGEREAELVQLHLEYNPQPVLSGGSPEKVSSETLQEMMTVLAQKGLNQRLDRVRKVAEEFNQSK
jgi:cyclohexyl-isocyanide hydratase